MILKSITKDLPMIKKLLALMAFSCLGTALMAQEGLHISLLAQPQNTWIFNQQDTDINRKAFSYEVTWGYAGMLKIGYNFADPIGIHIGGNYSVQGQTYDTQDTLGNTIRVDRQLTYVKIPLLLHINSDPAPAMFSFELGPQIGILLDANRLENGLEISYPFEQEQLFKANDISFTWAIGAEFMLTDWCHIVLQHRGDYSLFDIENKTFTFNNDLFYDIERDVAQNCTLGIMAGLNFCLAPGRGGGRNVKFWFR